MDKEMAGLVDTASIFRYHKDLAGKHGAGTTGALGWMQREGQQARFDMLSRMADMNGCSVLDAGCGHADLFPFLQDRYPSVIYYGCEQMPELLNIAAQRYKGKKGITLWLGDFLQSSLPQADYVLASGSLNYRHQDDGFIYKAISTLYAQCRKGFGFNLLSGGTEPGTLLVSYNPEEVFRFCITLSPDAELHRGYCKDDFTVFIYKK